jgi:glutamate-1-semialdehyde 2,1-aminomutase
MANLSTIWTVMYEQPGRYHWMLQFYLRKHGLALSWVGTGRLIFSLNYGDAEFAEVTDRFVAACDEMRADGWWWTAPELTAKAIRRSVFREMLGQKF